MKKLLFCIFMLTFFSFTLNVNARLDVERHRTGYYYFCSDNVKREILLFENLDTHEPIFQLNYCQNVDEFLIEPEEDTVLTYEELEKIKNYIMVYLDHRSFKEIDSWDLVNFQVLIWNLWKEKTGDAIRYSFGYNYTLGEELDEKLKTYWSPLEYSYEGVTDTEMNVSFVPMLFDTYSIEGVRSDATLEQKNHTFTFKASKPGYYTYEVKSPYFLEDVRFYKQDQIHLIEVAKPKEKPVFVHFQIEEKEKTSHHVLVLKENGIEVNLEKTDYLLDEKVSLDVKLDTSYELEDVKAMTMSGEEIPMDSFSFQMPNEDVVVWIKGKKEENKSHYLFVPKEDGVSFSIPNTALEGEWISFGYQLAEGYQLSHLKIFTISGKEIEIQNQTFQMPDEDLVFCFQMQKEEPQSLEENKEQQNLEEPSFLETYYIPNTKVTSLVVGIFFLLFMTSIYLILKRKSKI